MNIKCFHRFPSYLTLYISFCAPYLLDSAGFRQTAPYELFVTDSVFIANENYISVRFFSYKALGGAHGMSTFYAINYDIKTQKFIGTADIIDLQKATEIHALLKANLKNPDNCFSNDPTIDNATCVNFTSHTIDFTYAPYVLGPYACGYTTISIPKANISRI